MVADPTDITDDAQIAPARAVGARSLQTPHAVTARCSPARNRGEIDLASGWSVQVPRSFSARLAAASPQDCERVEMVDAGSSLHWPALDED